MYKVSVKCGYSYSSAFFSDLKAAKEKGLKKLIEIAHDEEGCELGKPTKYTQYKEDNDIFVSAYFGDLRLGYIMITPIKMDEWQ